jgi:hypothetical protein
VKLGFTVTALDGSTRTVEAGFSAQVRYEELAGRTVTSWKESPPGIRDWALLAWLGETNEATPFRAWTDAAEMVALTGVVSVDPTRPVAVAG